MSGNSRQRIEVQRKSSHEIDIMAEAGAITAAARNKAAEMMAPGVSTLEIDRAVEQLIRDAGAEPSFKGFRGYPATICIEINDIIVHGIPSDDLVIQDGDVVGVDVGAYYKGFHGDSATTVAVGEVSEDALDLMDATRRSLNLAIEQARAGNTIGDISRAIDDYIIPLGYGIVTRLLGHGIGREMHEPPQVPNYYKEGEFAEYDLTLRPGMVLAIEPMINMGTPDVRPDPDGWTVRTADGQLSVHYEHTVAITKDAPRILTVTT
ncbi:MAG: type I methionyl aminopeptidase [Armatimonadota bacterium]